MERVKKSYKVHIKVEQPKSKKGDSWSVPKVGAKASRVLSYWCFSPGFGKLMFDDQHSIQPKNNLLQKFLRHERSRRRRREMCNSN